MQQINCRIRPLRKSAAPLHYYYQLTVIRISTQNKTAHQICITTPKQSTKNDLQVFHAHKPKRPHHPTKNEKHTQISQTQFSHIPTRRHGKLTNNQSNFPHFLAFAQKKTSMFSSLRRRADGRGFGPNFSHWSSPRFSAKPQLLFNRRNRNLI